MNLQSESKKINAARNKNPAAVDSIGNVIFLIAYLIRDEESLHEFLTGFLCGIETITGNLAEEGFDLETYNPADFYQPWAPGKNGSTPHGEFPVPLENL
jgi:hypothetical protein